MGSLLAFSIGWLLRGYLANKQGAQISPEYAQAVRTDPAGMMVGVASARTLSGYTPTTTSAPTFSPTTYKFTFNGDGQRSSGTFTVGQATDPAIQWSYRSSSPEYGGIFFIYVHDAETNDVVDQVMSDQATSSGTQILRVPPGKYYLQVISHGKWNIVVTS